LGPSSYGGDQAAHLASRRNGFTGFPSNGWPPCKIGGTFKVRNRVSCRQTPDTSSDEVTPVFTLLPQDNAAKTLAKGTENEALQVGDVGSAARALNNAVVLTPLQRSDFSCHLISTIVY